MLAGGSRGGTSANIYTQLNGIRARAAVLYSLFREAFPRDTIFATQLKELGRGLCKTGYGGRGGMRIN